MVNPVTPNLSLEVPIRGAEVGTWDTPVNGDFTILDTSFGTVASIAMSTTSVVLATSQAQASVLRFTGALTASLVVTVPSSLVRKFWIAENLTTGSSAFVIQLQNNSTGEVIALPPGEPVDVFSDGTSMRFRNLGRCGSYLDMAIGSVPLWISNCTIPPYLNCNGAAFSSASYPYLTVQLGGTTLPDLRGTTRATLNQGTGRLTTAGGGVDGNTLLAIGGTQTQTLTALQAPVMTGVTASVGANNFALSNSVFSFASGGSGGVLPSDAGVNVLNVTVNATGGAAHPNVQPTTVGGITLIRAM